MSNLTVRTAKLNGETVVEVYDGHDGLAILTVEQSKEILSPPFKWDGNQDLSIDREGGNITEEQDEALMFVGDFLVDPFDIAGIQSSLEYYNN